MPAGTVKWFDTTKGYGFIVPEDGSRDVFVHISSIERSGLTGLVENQKVTYELNSGRDGREIADCIELECHHDETHSVNLKQSFSHERTKNVMVEIKQRKRMVKPKPVAAKPSGEAVSAGSPSCRPIFDAEMARRLKAHHRTEQEAKEHEQREVKKREKRSRAKAEKKECNPKSADNVKPVVQQQKPTSVGFIKWFGGINKRTGRHNDFGFIECINNEDLYFHGSQLKGIVPKENEFVVFTVQIENIIRKRAIEVEICRDAEDFPTDRLVEFLYDISGFQKMIASQKYRSVLNSLVNRSENSWALNFLSAMLPLSSSARFVVERMIEDRKQQVQLLDGLGILGITDADETCGFVPSHYFDERHATWIEWLKDGTQSERQTFFRNKINDLSLSFVLACSFEGVLNQSDDLGIHGERIADFVKEVFQKRFIAIREGHIGVELRDYVRNIYQKRFSGFDDFSRCPTISSYFEMPRVKQKIVQKDRSFISDVVRSEVLRGHPEAFLLSKLLPLIWNGNNDLTVESVFFHELWQAILSDQLDIDHPGFMKLFPSCGTFGRNLSCEAVYWSKGDYCFCRGRRCADPQVIPDLKKSYLDYNIYDWLSYFGCNYASAKQPNRRDFPIKLAGYFNRLKELRGVLNCRCCGTVMKPDFKYSRVQVNVYDEKTDRFHTEPFSAAYRTTVFYCGTIGCTERGSKYYLNHCFGSKCSSIVDSRDLESCDNGWYKCSSCGSCCKEHQLEAEQRKRELDQIIHNRRIRR